MIEKYAKMTYLALINPYNTVYKVYPQVIDEVRENLRKYGHSYFMGVKKDKVIDDEIIEKLRDNGFSFHTVDYKSLGGRAVDFRYVNPLSGKWMTGSSSATALNVLFGINDLGLGTDGGGSVLGPAISLNLFSFISPILSKDNIEYKKISTDGIEFSPSIGIISREFDTLRKTVEVLLNNSDEKRRKIKRVNISDLDVDVLSERKDLIKFLEETVVKGKILIADEGPVDFYGLGDSVFGNFSNRTKDIQKKSNKGLLRLVNMAGKSAISIPQEDLGSAKLLICDSNLIDIFEILDLAEEYLVERDELIDRYFLNYNMYFENI